ncbi:hypothetical protein BCF33_1586 [Hasllibacter halocynthiae]|uniref:DUF1285 domain-containing protein n=1 Tax=Hasllibacter halocynthiae TaxID=595589 RepID=A0A2T0X1B1_9RHOB|nr:DUF1285 domain-containing protein [Hasllibacter halocynthiae]PRY92732.1 hypothetical protein BCF33_1586 [Hasllibacter halocynthiae]
MTKGTRAHEGVNAPASGGNPTDALVRAARSGGKGPPPVHLWNPDHCGEIAIRILRDGTWLHEGTPIGRPALVRLFASILKREGDRHFLVTPVEKLGIEVEDAPFIAQDFEEEDGVLTFETGVGDLVAAGPENPITVEIAGDGEPAPYLHVRRGLMARIDRKTFYRLTEIGETEEVDGTPWFGVRSDGAFFPMIPVSALEG